MEEIRQNLLKQEQNKVYVTLFGKLDVVSPLYSNFIFTIHKGKSIWIVSDNIEFDNPYQKKVRLERKGTYRERQDIYDTNSFPVCKQQDEFHCPNCRDNQNLFVR